MDIENLIEKFSHVFISKDSSESNLVKRIQPYLKSGQWSWISEDFRDKDRGALSADEFDSSKRQLLIKPFKGQYFKRCPGAKPGLMCCNYFVLNWGLQCDMNCSYCYLQSFINTRYMTIYSNIEDALAELESIDVESTQKLPLRVGTGETVDSLSLDPLTGYSGLLIEFFRSRPNWKLEFKTKSNQISELIKIPASANVIVSWSVNPTYIVQCEEHGTASLKDRLTAARKCVDHGYQIAFHIDPIIWHPEWRENYGELVDQITRAFSPNEVLNLSVGSLRYQPEQIDLMRERFGMGSWVTRAEMFKSRDGKLRYDMTLRQEMLKFVMDRFKSHTRDWNIFICMETPEIWLKTDTDLPQKSNSLRTLFDPRVSVAFG